VIETTTVEVCPSCVLAIYTGVGFREVVDSLWRKFRGQISVDATESITTHRPCEGCGFDVTTIRYLGTVTIRSGEHA
jgi:hypothetical protein